MPHKGFRGNISIGVQKALNTTMALFGQGEAWLKPLAILLQFCCPDHSRERSVRGSNSRRRKKHILPEVGVLLAPPTKSNPACGRWALRATRTPSSGVYSNNMSGRSIGRVSALSPTEPQQQAKMQGCDFSSLEDVSIYHSSRAPVSYFDKMELGDRWSLSFVSPFSSCTATLLPEPLSSFVLLLYE